MGGLLARFFLMEAIFLGGYLPWGLLAGLISPRGLMAGDHWPEGYWADTEVTVVASSSTSVTYDYCNCKDYQMQGCMGM